MYVPAEFTRDQRHEQVLHREGRITQVVIVAILFTFAGFAVGEVCGAVKYVTAQLAGRDTRVLVDVAISVSLALIVRRAWSAVSTWWEGRRK